MRACVFIFFRKPAKENERETPPPSVPQTVCHTLSPGIPSAALLAFYLKHALPYLEREHGAAHNQHVFVHVGKRVGVVQHTNGTFAAALKACTLRLTGKAISPSVCRHMYETAAHELLSLSENEREDLALGALHSRRVASSIYVSGAGVTDRVDGKWRSAAAAHAAPPAPPPPAAAPPPPLTASPPPPPTPPQHAASEPKPSASAPSRKRKRLLEVLHSADNRNLARAAHNTLGGGTSAEWASWTRQRLIAAIVAKKGF